MTDREYLSLWRHARQLRKELLSGTKVRIEMAPCGSTFFGLFSDYEPVAIIDHNEGTHRMVIEYFVDEYNARHEQPITANEFIGSDDSGEVCFTGL